jgi:hypothetical protein
MSSVQSSVLWDVLIGKGIDGKFLATLIGLYAGASATLDVDGQLIGASMVGGTMTGNIEIQRGVRQAVHDNNDTDAGIPLACVRQQGGCRAVAARCPAPGNTSASATGSRAECASVRLVR